MGSCKDTHETTDAQAKAYMNNEIIWARLIVKAWEDPKIREQMKNASKAFDSNPDAVNNLLMELAKKFGFMDPPPVIPPGVKLKIVFDEPNLIHLILPSMKQTPPGPMMMVPHSL
jgi:hypothetical protein